MPAKPKVLMVALIGAAVVGGMSFDASAQLPGIGPCTGPHQMRALDLDMKPDPINQGQAVGTWVVKLQSDRNGECATFIGVKDRDQMAGAGVQGVIKPGMHSYPVGPAPNYKFQGQDSCFTVFVNIGTTQTAVDASKKFCAKLIPPVPQPPRWTLK